MLYLLDADDPLQGFPDPALAEREPDGLLAVGGDLSPERLLSAYRHGIFPWYSEDQPILWWSPDPRMALLPDRLHVSRSLRKTLRRGLFDVSFDRDFAAVIRGCAAPRPGADGTWILPDMIAAYERLFALGHAHSMEVWNNGELVGGLYGLSIGKAFFGESMFSRADDASKTAMAALCRFLGERDFQIIDCQVFNPHLQRMGAAQMPRPRFLALVNRACALHDDSWSEAGPRPPRNTRDIFRDD